MLHCDGKKSEAKGRQQQQQQRQQSQQQPQTGGGGGPRVVKTLSGESSFCHRHAGGGGASPANGGMRSNRNSSQSTRLVIFLYRIFSPLQTKNQKDKKDKKVHDIHTWASNGHFQTLMVDGKAQKSVRYYIRMSLMHGGIPPPSPPPCPCVMTFESNLIFLAVVLSE